MLLSNIHKSYGQIYNFDPIRHTNFETNPSILASSNIKTLISASHFGSPLPPGNFSYSNVRFSRYFERLFCGIGLTASNTKFNDSTSYNYLGIGAAYRNILFDKIYIKLGVLYKFIDIKAPLGNFAYYSFNAADSLVKNQNTQNLNLSFSISSPSDFYYISFGVMNNPTPWNTEKESFFPKYYFLNAGNLLKVFNRDVRNAEVSYTTFSKQYNSGKQLPLSHYILFDFPYHLSRRSVLKYGARLGLADNQYYHFTPTLSHYQKTGNRLKKGSFLITKLSVDLGYTKQNFANYFKPVTQLSLTYTL